MAGFFLWIVGVLLQVGVPLNRGIIFFGEFVLNFKVLLLDLIHLIEQFQHLLFVELVHSHGSIFEPFMASKPLLGGIRSIFTPTRRSSIKVVF